jgi:hypothetical protein
VLKNQITDCASEEVAFSIFALGSNEGQLVTVHYARTVLNLDYRHSKCTRHLRGRFSPSVLTFWLRLLCLGYSGVYLLQSLILFSDFLVRWI